MGKHVGGKLVLAGAVAAGAAVWAIKPRSFSDKQRHFAPSVPDVWYAHRGLHDAGSGLTPEYAAHSGEYVALARRCALRAGYGTADFSGSIAPENSLAAFAAACEAGFGIELDVQLTKDGRVVVVHDDNLLRVAGDPRKIADLTYEELSRIPLFPAPAKPGDAEAAPVATRWPPHSSLRRLLPARAAVRRRAARDRGTCTGDRGVQVHRQRRVGRAGGRADGEGRPTAAGV